MHGAVPSWPQRTSQPPHLSPPPHTLDQSIINLQHPAHLDYREGQGEEDQLAGRHHHAIPPGEHPRPHREHGLAEDVAAAGWGWGVAWARLCWGVGVGVPRLGEVYMRKMQDTRAVLLEKRGSSLLRECGWVGICKDEGSKVAASYKAAKQRHKARVCGPGGGRLVLSRAAGAAGTGSALGLTFPCSRTPPHPSPYWPRLQAVKAREDRWVGWWWLVGVGVGVEEGVWHMVSRDLPRPVIQRLHTFTAHTRCSPTVASSRSKSIFCGVPCWIAAMSMLCGGREGT